MDNPYSRLSEQHFWGRSIANIEAHLVDPVTAPRFSIGAGARVATAGSCFAQHISRFLMESGCTYFVPEDDESLSSSERIRQNYGLFSARYGNIYSVAQLNQLYDAAFGWRSSLDSAWTRPDGRVVDPVRQQAVPDGFADIGELAEDRQRHHAAVRRLFCEADVFIFTLGLTEAWRSRRDGTIYSAAPGVVAGQFDPELHEFVNFSVSDVHASLRKFLVKLRALNPKINVMITVSPVPLKASYEDCSVLLANTYSKSVLRVAAEMAYREFDWVDYFPSYEIITGIPAGGRYFEDDLRSIRRSGVAHVMRIFSKHYLGEVRSLTPGAIGSTSTDFAVVCDEEILDAIAG